MKKFLFITLLIVFTFKLYSQEIIFDKDVKLKSSFFNDKRESFPIVNSSKNEIALFLLDKKTIDGFLFDNNYEIIGSYTTERPIGNYNIILGHSEAPNGYHLFFSNSRQNKFSAKFIDVSGKKSHDKIQEFKLKGERFLEAISYKGKFYILTIKNQSSVIKIYVFDGNTLSNTKEINLSKYKLSKSTNTTLSKILSENGGNFNTVLNIQKIENKNPNPLDLTTKKNKIYCYDDKIYITLDNNIENTKLITIDLNSFKMDAQLYKQGSLDCDHYKISSNSYLSENFLYQITGCKSELYFSIFDFTKHSLIKEFRVTKDEEITFKNTPLIQEGGTTMFTKNSKKELRDTQKILKKISLSDIGITVYQAQNNLEITIGGFKEVKQNSGGGMMMTNSGSTFSAPNGSTVVIQPTYYYNPTMYGYNSYTNTRSVFFKSLFNRNNFNHIPGNISSNSLDKNQNFEDENHRVFNNAFDKIIGFENDNDNITTQTIFKVDNYYVFGYYDKKEKKYILRKFMD